MKFECSTKQLTRPLRSEVHKEEERSWKLSLCVYDIIAV